MLHNKLSPSPNSPPPPNAFADAHEEHVEAREAYEYWGYLFRPDKTGSPKLKSLLRGLKEVMNCSYENNNNSTHDTSSPASAPHEQPDLTPTQLAHFYRDLHGNYDQLFLATPNESIAFIYKSLGCLHSLQPLRHATQTGEMANGDRATAFTDPVVPALKTEGWIMWQTIQILLGPEEHAQFLREAVEKWDVKDVETGDVFPKILPRECFPREPDRHMVAWYEGVSERLRKEAEAEEAAKFDSEGEEEGRPRRLRGRRDVEDDGGTDDESVDSRAPALAYFRNPLYRHSDGRPSIVRHSSKRPGLSPRQTMIGKGKDAVGTFGRIAKNVGSPHLWDGRGGSRSGSAHNAAAGGKRRQSHPHIHHSANHEHVPPNSSGSDRRDHSHQSRRTGSSPRDAPQQRPTSAVSSTTVADDDWWDESEVGSPPPAGHGHNNNHRRVSPSTAAVGGGLAAAAASRHGNSHSRSHSQHVPTSRDGRKEGQHRRHRSAEPTPSGPDREGEPADYFAGANEGRRGSAPNEDRGRHSEESGAGAEGGGGRRPSTTPPPVPAGNGVGVSFGPSAGPLFASTIARSGSVAGRGERGERDEERGGRDGGRGGRDDGRGGRGDGRRGSAVEGTGRHSHPHPHRSSQDMQRLPHRNRHHQHDPSRMDDSRRGDGRYDDSRRYDSPRRSGGGGGGRGYEGPPPNQRFDEGRRGSRDSGRRPPAQEFYDDGNDDRPPPRRSIEDSGRGSGDFARNSRDDVGGGGRSREDVGPRRSGGRKQTRFAGDDGGGGGGQGPPAERGVSGRRYPDGSPWGGRGGGGGGE